MHIAVRPISFSPSKQKRCQSGPFRCAKPIANLFRFRTPRF